MPSVGVRCPRQVCTVLLVTAQFLVKYHISRTVAPYSCRGQLTNSPAGQYAWFGAFFMFSCIKPVRRTSQPYLFILLVSRVPLYVILFLFSLMLLEIKVFRTVFCRFINSVQSSCLLKILFLCCSKVQSSITKKQMKHCPRTLLT